MRNLSRKAQQTMENRRDFYAVGEITFADGTQKTLSKEDFSLTGNSVIDSSGSTSFPLGLLIPKQITLSLVNDDDRWSEYDFYGASIYLQTKFDLDDSTTESLNIGTFTVISPETYGTTVEVTAMDDSYKTDKPYDTQNDYPMSVAVALRDCCETCDILLGTTSFANSDYIIPQKPENLTHRQFIGLCAQIAGGNARFDEFNRLEIIAYDFSPLGITAIDGGTFQPWTKGENYDGGTFDPWTTGDTIDGGTFGDRDNIHVLYQYKSGIVIEVDDVVITGVQMESEDEEGNKTTHLYGKEGYVLSLENQLAVGKEEEVLRRIGEKIVGITFRPFSGDHIALPTAEFMDLAYIIDRKQNVYKTVLTDVTFNYFGYTNLKCTADSPLRNSSTHLSNEVKAIIEARKMVERERTEREKALDNLADQLAKSSGLYLTEDVQPDKSVIYYMHDKPTLEESMIVWKLTANAFGISNDGGKTYPYGLDASGVAILERIYAIGINCNYLKTGSIKIEKNGKVMVLMDMDTGQVILRPDTFELSSGATIQSIAEDAASSKSKTFTSTPVPPYHVGDLWYGGTSSDVKVCTRERLTGYYNSGDWAKRDRYIDSSAATTAATNAANTAVSNKMTQTNIFNALTNNGQIQGIYLQNGRIYINAEYIASGLISADRIDTSNLVAKQVNSTNGQYWAKIVNGRFSGGYNYSTENGYLDLTSNITMNNKPLYPVALRAYNNMVLWANDNILLYSQSGDIQILRGTVGRLHIAGTVDGLNGKQYINYFYLTGNALMWYDASGQSYAIVYNSSDAKIKKEIFETTEKGLDVINAIGHCTFDFIDERYEDDGHRDCGYIAQQLETVKPEFVLPCDKKNEKGEIEGYVLQINTNEILPYATKAIQELSEENDGLKKKYEELSEENETLKSRVASLEERLAALERRLG